MTTFSLNSALEKTHSFDPQNAFSCSLTQDKFCFCNEREWQMNQWNNNNISMGWRLLISFLLRTKGITTKSVASFRFLHRFTAIHGFVCQKLWTLVLSKLLSNFCRKYIWCSRDHNKWHFMRKADCLCILLMNMTTATDTVVNSA